VFLIKFTTNPLTNVVTDRKTAMFVYDIDLENAHFLAVKICWDDPWIFLSQNRVKPISSFHPMNLLSRRRRFETSVWNDSLFYIFTALEKGATTCGRMTPSITIKMDTKHYDIQDNSSQHSVFYHFPEYHIFIVMLTVIMLTFNVQNVIL